MTSESVLEPFTEYEVEFENEVKLKGTVTKPSKEGKYPAVIIINNSGEIDRDGTIFPNGIKTNIYKDLACLLGRLDLVTLRYDKRGVGESEGEFFRTGMWDLVSDIQAAITFLKTQSFVDTEKVILLGHSEGAVLAAAANAKTPVNGIILLSGAAESLEEAMDRQRQIMYEQLKSVPGFKGAFLRFIRIDKINERQIKSVKRKILNSKKDIMKMSGNTINAKWMREHYQYDLYADLKKIVCPLLAIASDKDIQSNPEKTKRIGDYIQGTSEVHIIENMNHGLKEFEGDFETMGLKYSYSEEAKKPLHPELQKAITNWIENF